MPCSSAIPASALHSAAKTGLAKARGTRLIAIDMRVLVYMLGFSREVGLFRPLVMVVKLFHGEDKPVVQAKPVRRSAAQKMWPQKMWLSLSISCCLIAVIICSSVYG